ncbi:hypothetical protein [Streptomyces alboflavus]|uniref:hypothetical protein n=1 Tax=Streptomyces alboflavus TaxID=67267 RepID=UPI0036C94122
MNRRTMPVTAALAAAAALLLTGCGSGGDGDSKDDDKIVGADQGPEKPKKSTGPSPTDEEPDGVDLSLPKDMKLVFDWETPKAKNEASAMSDAANYVRAIYHGVDKRTAKNAAVSTYATGEGLHYAKVQIDSRVDDGWTATGTRRHYQADTRSTANGTSVEVAFCADSSKFYGKDVKTGKVQKTKPSVADFDHFRIIMVKYPTGKERWQASKVFVEEKAEQCQ